MKRIFATLILSFAVIGPVTADDSLYTKQFSTCMDKTGGVTSAMLNCIRAETVIQDAKLNTVYKKLGEQLTLARKNELRAVQRLWIQYRDANCGFYADPDGGTLAIVTGNDCVLEETALRAKELESFLAEY
ncbi:MAG: DUF1311 domain-containing protein [Gammaproteobacteria bacterium]|nr:lysozyme inhibitor LprI family protein [Pseudomonas sp.]NLO53066.1 DUF1311 domain-containing protein [Gammaproteobacteria bacterium]